MNLEFKFVNLSLYKFMHIINTFFVGLIDKLLLRLTDYTERNVLCSLRFDLLNSF